VAGVLFSWSIRFGRTAGEFRRLPSGQLRQVIRDEPGQIDPLELPVGWRHGAAILRSGRIRGSSVGLSHA